MWRVAHGASFAAGLVLLASCFAPVRAPVMDRSLVDGTPDSYQVGRHDTLYSIAWRFNMDYEALAAANGIGPPYLIREGQRIQLTTATSRPRPVRVERRSNTLPTAAVSKPTPVSTGVERAPVAATPGPPASQPNATESARAAPASGRGEPARSPQPAAKTAASGSRVAAPSKPPPAKKRPPPPAKPRARPPIELATVAADGWRRPVTEAPVRRFGGASKGFDYQLGPATQIRAASGGIVVYAGPGLGGFRHLVIVKASDRYLVAYGVNATPALREGETVLPGTVVARIDSGGPTAGKFHFEIRDRGTPVDPGKLLPG